MNVEKEIILTAIGLKRIKDELDHLRTVNRREIAARIQDAKEYGDLAENSEYENAKTEQAFVEGRIIELKRVLQNAIVLDDSEISTDVVGVGTKVTVKDLDADDEWEFAMVGSFEADPSEDRISNESPVGEALMGRRVGDVVDVETPMGIAKYEIVRIRK